MEKQTRQKIVIVGCGNVAWQLAKKLHSLKKFQITVYNHLENPLLNDFKTKLKCKIGVGLDHIIEDASIYFICVTDKFISQVSEKIKIKDPQSFLLHTSGSAKIEELGERIHNTGVFYPLQTFSKEDLIDWSKVPIIIESSKRDAEHSILWLADLFSKSVISLQYKDRLKLHLAAVFVNNFTNALYVEAFDLINSNSTSKDLNFEILLPLIEQTTQKIKQLNPHAAQTGPAKRGDEVVMKKHTQLLSKYPDRKKLYKQLSKLIARQQKS